MDEELYEFAKDNDLSFDEAKEVQDVADENGIDLEEALEVYEDVKE